MADKQKKMKFWEIRFRQSGGTAGAIECELAEKPSREQAAQLLRDELYQPFIIPNTPPGIKDKTVYQLERLGVTILDIVEIPTN